MVNNGPWQIKERVLKYKNKYGIEVYEDQVVRPDGKEGIHAYIKAGIGVCVLPLDSEGNVYLTKEFHYATEAKTIEIVAGGIESNEDPLVAAKRELLEELGIVAREWVDLGEIFPLTTVVTAPMACFLAKDLSFQAPSQEGSETIEILKVKFEEAIQMVLNNEIKPAVTCSVILKAARMLGI